MSKEILMVVDAVSNEKGVEKEIIFEAMEAALASATRKKHGGDIEARVAINRELDNLRVFLENVRNCLSPGGKLAVISFHSLEDGMVKRFVRAAGVEGWMKDLTKRPVIAEPKERKANPRSRSAKLRVAQRID